jgi:HEAT repeat protein
MACALLASITRAGAQGVDVSSTTRLESVMASIRARDPRAVPGLAAAFGAETEGSIRAWIVRGAAALGAPQGPALFQTALQDPSPLVRMAAVEALAKTQGAKAVPDLAAALAAETNAGVRHAIVAGLGSIRTAASAAALRQALTGDNDPNVRIQAARSLRRHGSAAAKQAVRDAKNDRDARVRAIANEP